MKKLFLLPLLAAALSAHADPADDALLSAQSAYRTALKNQNDTDSKIISLQKNLADAQERQRKAQEDIGRLQNELQTASAAKTGQASALQQTAQQLDAAWNAVYGAGGTRAPR